MIKPAQPRPLALPHSQIGSRGSWPSPVENDNLRSSPPVGNGNRTVGMVDMETFPETSAEIAQARHFEAILRAEFAHLDRLAYNMAGPLDRLKRADFDSSQPSRELVRIHARIDEVHRLLVALQGRFPHTRVDGQRPTE